MESLECYDGRRLKRVSEQARKHVKNVLGLEYSGHDYWHIYRVWKLAQRIAKEENANRLTVEIAALLHDLGDSKTSSYDKESDPARKWLSKVSKDKQLIHDVCHIIDNMSYRKELEDSDVKLSKEGEVVQDADRLDAIGAIGISRAFVFSGYKNNVVHNPSIEPNADMSSEMYRKNDSTAINHFYEKLLLLKDRMNTDAGKELAKERHKFMEEFLDRFFLEWEGKK